MLYILIDFKPSEAEFSRYFSVDSPPDYVSKLIESNGIKTPLVTFGRTRMLHRYLTARKIRATMVGSHN